MMKEIYESQAGEIRKNISIAAAEIERLRANRKLTSKGKKNRAKHQKNYKSLSIADLVVYMERKKSKLPKLKRHFCCVKRLEEARKLNQKFYADPGRIYATFGKMLESQADIDKPTYDTVTQGTQVNNYTFTNINEERSFWKRLWEEEGSGDTEAEWIEKVREAMEDVVPEVPTDGWNLNAEQVTKIINTKKNRSAPGPDCIANFWWKKATILHKEIATCFQAIAQLEDLQFPLWFSEGKTTLIPKPGEFRSDNQRPIICLNNLYKWYTSYLLAQANQHIETYGLIQREQRGARGNCSGTVDNLLIDWMVCEDAQRGKRNLSMAWIDVAKAYDSVDHGWLSEMFTLHRFPIWFAKVMEKLANSWNTRIVAQTTQGKEISPTICFKKGLPQGDALCPMLFVLLESNLMEGSHY